VTASSCTPGGTSGSGTDLASRGGPYYGYRLIVRRQAEDFNLTIGSPFVNLPAGGTMAIGVTADRRGYDGVIQLTIPDLPKGVRVEGGIIPRAVFGHGQRANHQPPRSSAADRRVRCNSPVSDLQVWGEATLADGTCCGARRAARHRSGRGRATDQGVVDRQRP